MRLRKLLIGGSILFGCLVAAIVSAVATINSATNKTITLGNGSTTQFTFSFVGDQPGYISVIYTDASGNQTTLTQGNGPTQYQLTLNPAVSPGLWGIGGTVTYDPSTPIAAGTSLTIIRTLPFVQNISLLNLASLTALANAAETGLDQLEMQIQQLAENINRVVAGPVSDPAGINYTLPTVAQRANTGMAFDGNGNVIAGTIPATGVISSAMQPVVNAATLAAGRTAFGLGSAATGAINYGLQQGVSGTGLIDANSTPVQDSTNQTVIASFHDTFRVCTGPISYTMPRANTTWAGFGFWVYAVSGLCTITPNSSDSFSGLSSGTSISVPPGSWVFVTTNAASLATWWVDYHGPTNADIVAGVSGSALTFTFYSGPLQFRDTTLGNGDPVWSLPANGITITVPSTATVGSSSNTPFRVWLFAAHNSGTPVLGVATCSNPTTIFACAAWEAMSTSGTAISTGATSAGTLYTASSVSNDSVIILGYADFCVSGSCTAGTWVAPTTVQLCLAPRSCRKPGDTIQITSSATSSVAITPTSAINLVDVTAMTSSTGTTGAGIMALKRGSTGLFSQQYNGSSVNDFPFSYGLLDSPKTNSSTTYSLSGTNLVPSTANMTLKEIMGQAKPVNDNDAPEKKAA